MAGKSSIEWTEQTWNPIVGCSIVSPGCTNCYAMRSAWRKHHNPATPHYRDLTKKVKGNPVWTGKLALAPDSILLAPLKRKKPTTYFANSMGDLFHEDCPDEWIDRVFAVMALTPHHTYQVLTKRAARMRDYFDHDDLNYRISAALGCMLDGEWVWNAGKPWRLEIENLISCFMGVETAGEGEIRYRDDPMPLPNVWLGVSAERQAETDERIPLLLQTPAAIRFISAEPLLGPIDLIGTMCRFQDDPIAKRQCAVPLGEQLINWVIVGGESGSKARPMHPAWARSLRDQCSAAGVAFFFKQWGEWWFDPHPALSRGTTFHKFEDGTTVERVGKKLAGRLLDGVEHNGFPARAEP